MTVRIRLNEVRRFFSSSTRTGAASVFELAGQGSYTSRVAVGLYIWGVICKYRLAPHIARAKVKTIKYHR